MSFALALVTGAGFACAQGPVHVVSHTVNVDRQAKVARFEIVYDRKPDFFTLDPQGRPADSFQFHLDTAPANGGIGGGSPWKIIIRGDEIHLKGDIRVRDHTRGPSPEPGSGGWGPVVGSVPYTLVGGRQSFEVPLSMLNSPEAPPVYSLEAYRYGTLVERFDSAPGPATPPAAAHPAPVPDDAPDNRASSTPGERTGVALALPSAALAVIGLAGATRARRRRRGVPDASRPPLRPGNARLSGPSWH